MEVFAAGDSLAPTPRGQTEVGIVDVAIGSVCGMADIFWNKQVRKCSYNTTMFYVSYYLAYSYGL